jgi:hypothetical protein
MNQRQSQLLNRLKRKLYHSHLFQLLLSSRLFPQWFRSHQSNLSLSRVLLLQPKCLRQSFPLSRAQMHLEIALPHSTNLLRLQLLLSSRAAQVPIPL